MLWAFDGPSRWPASLICACKVGAPGTHEAIDVPHPRRIPAGIRRPATVVHHPGFAIHRQIECAGAWPSTVSTPL